MKHLELHILQSVPVSCLNRDDFGSPKTAIFGGVPRARVSSQCWKRAARELMQKESPEYFAGSRTRRIISEMQGRIQQKVHDELQSCQGQEKERFGRLQHMIIVLFEKLGLKDHDKLINDIKEILGLKDHDILTDGMKKVIEEEDIKQQFLDLFENIEFKKAKEKDKDKVYIRDILKKDIIEIISSYNYPINDDNLKELNERLIDHLTKADALYIASVINKLDDPPVQVKTLFFTSPHELDLLVEAYFDEHRDAPKAVKQLKNVSLTDAADIALFGRMVANDHSLTLEGAAMFSHALSTHRASNEIDFFSAVDDLKPEDAEDAGAAMTGTLEFNSATYYRFAALNLGMLADSRHLGALTVEERQQVVRMFVEAVIRAVPTARHTSMNAATLPSFVLVVVREKGHPVQLVNAFEEPVWSPRGGLVAASRKKLEEEYARLQETWGITADAEFRIPDMPLNKVLEEVVKHVV